MKIALSKSLDLKKVDESYLDALKCFVKFGKAELTPLNKIINEKDGHFLHRRCRLHFKTSTNGQKKTERFAN